MKILYLADGSTGELPKKYLQSLCHDITSSGNKVFLFSADGTAKTPDFAVPASALPENLDGGTPFGKVLLSRRLARLLQKEHFDILHALTPTAASLLRKSEIPETTVAVVSVLCRNDLFYPVHRPFFGEFTISETEEIREILFSRFALPAERIAVLPPSPIQKSSDKSGIVSERSRTVLSVYHSIHRETPVRTLLLDGKCGDASMEGYAALSGILAAMRQAAPDVRLRVLSAKPEETEARFGISAIRRANLFALIGALFHADMLLCHGTFTQSDRPLSRFAKLLFRLRLSRQIGVLPVLYAVTLSHRAKASRAQKQLTTALTQNCAYLSTADSATMHRLHLSCIDPAHLHEGADPTVLMPLPPVTRCSAILLKNGISQDCAYLCVLLRGGKEQLLPCRITKTAIRLFCLHNHLIPIFIALSDRDRRASRAGAAHTGGHWISLREASDAAALFAGAVGTISFSLPGLVLATAAHCPVIGIPTGEESDAIVSFANAAGQELLPLSHLTAPTLTDRMQALLAERKTRANLLALAAADLRATAKKDLANLTAMLYNKKRKTKPRSNPSEAEAIRPGEKEKS